MCLKIMVSGYKKYLSMLVCVQIWTEVSMLSFTLRKCILLVEHVFSLTGVQYVFKMMLHFNTEVKKYGNKAESKQNL